jgi:CCR4-NOT transcription complex subunit 1
MVVRTHTGLEDAHGTHATFYISIFNSSISDSSWLSSWNIDVLLDSIKQPAPEINWVSVMESLDQEGFYLPDQKAFSILMSIYGKTCQDPFPIQTVCGSVWKNDEGQLSFLRFAVSASPEVFTFAHSRRQQAPLEGPHGSLITCGSANQAWLSVDLVEVLCHLAEIGHGSAVHTLLEYPIKYCPEILLIVVA